MARQIFAGSNCCNLMWMLPKHLPTLLVDIVSFLIPTNVWNGLTLPCIDVYKTVSNKAKINEIFGKKYTASADALPCSQILL